MTAQRPGSGLYAFEQEVMDRWDRGESIDAIVEATGRKRDHVSGLVSMYRVPTTCPHEKMVRSGTHALLVAIAARHPERISSWDAVRLAGGRLPR
jgi:hypothetical protein